MQGEGLPGGRWEDARHEGPAPVRAGDVMATAGRWSDKAAAPPPEECLQLLSRATQVFREQYVLKQDLAKEEIQRRYRPVGPTCYPRGPPAACAAALTRVHPHRVRLLCDQKQKQLEDLNHCREER